MSRAYAVIRPIARMLLFADCRKDKKLKQNNRTIIFLGSSVTWGADGYSMCEYIAGTTGVDVVKWALSGTTLADINEDSYVRRMLAAIDSQERCDHFVCQLSTNDASRAECVTGEISDSFDPSDFDTGTTVGAIEFIIASARKRWGCPVSFYTGTFFENEKYRSMVEILLRLKEKWQIRVLDLWNDPEMRSVSAADYAEYMSDPVHPTKKGYDKWWGPKFIEYLNL